MKATPASGTAEEPLEAGVSRVDITRGDTGTGTGPPGGDPLYANIDAQRTHDPLYVKALVVRQGGTVAVIITVDAVALAEIGTLGNDFVGNVRARLHETLGIPPHCVLFNASHCHGLVCADVEDRAVQAVTDAWSAMEPVRPGCGAGREDRIMENRRLRLKDGSEADVRHAYSLPPDDELLDIGPVDPEIGVLRLDRRDGSVLAVLFNFACHPIQGVPGKGNTADITGFACRVIEEGLGHGTTALFLQGCAGDVNPAGYKTVDQPRDAEPLGHLLGLSVLRAVHRIRTHPAAGTAVRIEREMLRLPRADLAPFIRRLKERRDRLTGSLEGTFLDLKTFISLWVKYGLSPDFPGAHAHRYLHEERMGRDHLVRMDAENRSNLQRYVANIRIMEELTRLQTNLGLLEMHHARNLEAGEEWVDAEVMGLRIGDFALLAFPGELSVQIGLDLKARSPHPHTFVSGVSNGYLYYTPTAEQLRNRGGAQEDSDCLVAPEWQALFERTALEILGRL